MLNAIKRGNFFEIRNWKTFKWKIGIIKIISINEWRRKV